jgi:excisionase family DNA binding protein
VLLVSAQAAAPMAGSTFRAGACFALKQPPPRPQKPHAPPPAHSTTSSERHKRSNRLPASVPPRSRLGRPPRATARDRSQPTHAQAEPRRQHGLSQGYAKATPWWGQGSKRREPPRRCAPSQGTRRRSCRRLATKRCARGVTGAPARPWPPRRIPARAAHARDSPDEIVTDSPSPMNNEHDHQHRPRRPLTRADVMTAAEVAKLLALPKSTVYELARRGELPCARLGRTLRFVREDVEARLRNP